MRIAVIGSGGMLGKAMVQTAAQCKHEVLSVPHERLDITDSLDVYEELSDISPDIVINCAGIVKGGGENDMMAVNTLGPVYIATSCNDIGCRLVHISTDCVFDGRGCYTEIDKPNADDIYGVSKSDGEILSKNHLTIRCSFIGLGPRGLLSWLIKQQGSVSGYINSLWNGFTTKYVAQEILKQALSGNTGIQHIFGHDTNKYDVLCAANKVFNLGLNIIPEIKPVIDYRLRTVTDYQVDVPPIEKQIMEMKDAYSLYSRRSR